MKITTLEELEQCQETDQIFYQMAQLLKIPCKYPPSEEVCKQVNKKVAELNNILDALTEKIKELELPG